jgi:hypothetical protein
MKHLFIFVAAISFSYSASATSPVPSENEYLRQQVKSCLADMPDYLICKVGDTSWSMDLLGMELGEITPATDGLVLEHWGDRFELVGIKYRYMLKDSSVASFFFWCPGQLSEVKLLTRTADGVASETAAVCSGVDSPLEE